MKFVLRKRRRQSGEKSSEKKNKRSRMWTQPTPECYWCFDAQNGSYTERLVVSCCCCCCCCRRALLSSNLSAYTVRVVPHAQTLSLSLSHTHKRWHRRAFTVFLVVIWRSNACEIHYWQKHWIFLCKRTHTRSQRHNHMCMARTGYWQPVDRMNQSALNVW